MSDYSAIDRAHMERALSLAERGVYTAYPNPMVGCVIVRDGEIVGEGYHKAAGEAHAEVNALAAADDKARGATAYVTLEPCAHHGKTPPCIDALIDAGIAAVVAALEDPYPKVAGRGFAALEKAGIGVRVGLMRAEAEELLRGFLSRVTRGRPFVRLKIASSLDGRIAMANGESQWITGPVARADVQRLRARSGAIMTGIGTVLADDPSLTVRDASLDTGGRQPLRVVLDKDLRMPLSAEMLGLPGDTVIYCVDDRKRQALVDAGAEVVKIAADDGLVQIAAVLDDLGARAINELLVEAGPALAGSLVENQLVDELVIYQAPHIMGSETMGMFQTPSWVELADRQTLEITDVRSVGADTRITARLTG
ncbi:MAG: bifunctional diaminohydroxyphosphoribosylaminopyrimidine deaminase/5-amino-6-(5-phosphoribosylamino)uracil reductase RibD [Woeseiaceae bacterium]